MLCSCGTKFDVVLKPFEHYECKNCGRMRSKKNRKYKCFEGITTHAKRQLRIESENFKQRCETP